MANNITARLAYGALEYVLGRMPGAGRGGETGAAALPAGSMQLVAIARNPIPTGATVGAFPGYDGAPLRFARWAATRGPERGTVCLFTGRGELIEKYFETIADLRRRGFAVAIMDWRGQGGSYRPLPNLRKGHIRSFAEHEDDIAAFMREVVVPACPAPYIAFAHSMGGNVLLRHASRADSPFERIVLSAPMILVHPDRLGAAPTLARGIAAAATAFGLGTFYVPGGSDHWREATSFETNLLTSDRERFLRNEALVAAAPHLQIGAPTIGWLAAALGSCRRLSQPGAAEAMRVPMLIFVAGDDRIVSSRAIEDFAAQLKVGTVVALPGARHEILHETDAVRARVWAAFDAYFGISG